MCVEGVVVLYNIQNEGRKNERSTINIRVAMKNYPSCLYSSVQETTKWFKKAYNQGAVT